MPSIVLGELYYGAYKSAHPDANTRRIDELPENDIWIAAIARQHGLTVISRDQHFKEIENLPVETW